MTSACGATQIPPAFSNVPSPVTDAPGASISEVSNVRRYPPWESLTVVASLQRMP